MNKKEYLTVGIHVVSFRVEDIISTSGEQDKYALDIYEGGWQDENVKR